MIVRDVRGLRGFGTVMMLDDGSLPGPIVSQPAQPTAGGVVSVQHVLSIDPTAVNPLQIKPVGTGSQIQQAYDQALAAERSRNIWIAAGVLGVAAWWFLRRK